MIREKHCWPSSEKGFIWSVIGPIGIIITVNFIIFILALHAAAKVDRINSTNNTCREKRKCVVKRLKGMTSLMCLLGFTWAFGFFYVPKNPAISAYLFVILNGLQVLSWHTVVDNPKAKGKVHPEQEQEFTDINSTTNVDCTPSAPPLDADFCKVRHTWFIQLEQPPSHPFGVNTQKT
ncbi:adhesion G protein-coupled receptor L4-like isoform X2 [Stegodyphus dumicola]|uniref:adhesion G protein-coupled receptor L4-like isoform X2 n=1 Tax=Stegodyphus dumicola TaxID=202533 RepID=UPI0015B34E76|nr:adhesion G protein-coupled receptor L4-like isoform X2 [Stegodyphus dumicola]